MNETTKPRFRVEHRRAAAYAGAGRDEYLVLDRTDEEGWAEIYDYRIGAEREADSLNAHVAAGGRVEWARGGWRKLTG